MGASISVVNKAVYDIQVDLYKPKDIEGLAVMKQYTLLPGETKAIKVGKGANIRISGEFLPVIWCIAWSFTPIPNPKLTTQMHSY